MADDQLFQSMLSLYEKASRGEVYPDAMVASESWFRFRMGDEAYNDAFQAGRATYFSLDVLGPGDEDEEC